MIIVEDQTVLTVTYDAVHQVFLISSPAGPTSIILLSSSYSSSSSSSSLSTNLSSFASGDFRRHQKHTGAFISFLRSY